MGMRPRSRVATSTENRQGVMLQLLIITKTANSGSPHYLHWNACADAFVSLIHLMTCCRWWLLHAHIAGVCGRVRWWWRAFGQHKWLQPFPLSVKYLVAIRCFFLLMEGFVMFCMYRYTNLIAEYATFCWQLTWLRGLKNPHRCVDGFAEAKRGALTPIVMCNKCIFPGSEKLEQAQRWLSPKL